jgi:hypothetical protein
MYIYEWKEPKVQDFVDSLSLKFTWAFGLGFYRDCSKVVAHPLDMSKLPFMHVKWSKDSILETLK